MAILVQMHGDPGSGKSTLARAIGRLLPAIVLDKDALSSANIRAGVDPSLAGPAAYEAMRELGADLLAAGHNVIFDSACAWPIIEERGRALAARFGVVWAMIETACPDAVIDERLGSRSGRESQPAARTSLYARPGTCRPSCERLVLDSTRPAGELAIDAVIYLRTLSEGSPLAGAVSNEAQR